MSFPSNGVELKAERRKPSGEKHCDIEVIPPLTGVLAHFRFYEFNARRACTAKKAAVGRTELGGAKRPIEIDAQDGHSR
jgi:hypothetical protein